MDGKWGNRSRAEVLAVVSAQEESMQAREQLERFSMGVVWVRTKDMEVAGMRNGEKGFSVVEE